MMAPSREKINPVRIPKIHTMMPQANIAIRATPRKAPMKLKLIFDCSVNSVRPASQDIMQHS
jgi:hypothetical protein